MRFLSMLVVFTLVGYAPALAGSRAGDHAKAFRDDANRWLKRALAELEVVPGLGIAVVVDEEVVLAKSFGVADVERGVPADENTAYYIASSTKSFTGLTAAILDARGVLRLDDSLSEHLHGARLDPSLKPDEVVLRDLLTHTSGVDNGPIAVRLAYTGQHDPATLWKLLDDSTPTEEAPLGTFRYTNVGYNIYGMILERVSGKAWQDHLRDELFRPLGLTRTTAYASLPVREGWTVARPHFGLDPNGIRKLTLEKRDNTMQSAGGMLASPRDMGRWLEFQVNEGKLDEKQIVPSNLVKNSHRRLAETSNARPPFGRTGYGLGWFHGTYRDRVVLHHGGGFAGFRSLISFMPDERVGVAVLINEGSLAGQLMGITSMWAYDWWLEGVETTEADSRLDELIQGVGPIRKRFAAELEKRAARPWMLERPLGAYTGTFASDLWGTVEITRQSDVLQVAVGNLSCLTEPFDQPETLRVELVPGQGRVVVFEPAEGSVDRIVLDGDTYERVH